MAELSIEDQIKQDLTEAALDVFEPTDFGYEIVDDILNAIVYNAEGEEVTRYAVSITIDVDEL